MDQTRSLLQIADRLETAFRHRKVARLKPETALLAALALRSWCINPFPQDIGRALCSVRDGYSTVCMGCLGKANVIHRLYNGEKM
ncbi:hypothetical protein GGR03_003786 [Aurantimonas endophytica]|uniref:Uncharacterized protein n=1 Tax=Aurantimonas endophytica TaxID=1522175 RepID=A0A7W6HGD9_9HYPH|nr:hypothetical protein [Aurantimonas endophytica]